MIRPLRYQISIRIRQLRALHHQKIKIDHKVRSVMDFDRDSFHVKGTSNENYF